MKKISLFFLSLCLLSFMANAQSIKPFEKGDRIAFVGNSITHGGHYHSNIWLYYMTRFPDRRITILNKGIGANDVGQMNARLDDDIIADHPDVIFLTFGMNDAGYFEYLNPKADSIAKEKIQKAYNSYLLIEQKLKDHPQIEKVLISSSPYDETVKVQKNYFPGKSKAMREIADFQETSAKKNGWNYIDINRQMTDITIKEQAKDTLYSLALDDRIHLNNAGHMVMAYLILKAQGLAGSSIADVAINAADGKTEKTVNCKITGLSVSKNAVEFNYLANALPYPVDTVARSGGKVSMADALKVIPFTDEFNKEMLTVKGLDTAKLYRLKIDETEIGTWSAQDFERGINLAELAITPQNQQANAIMHLNEERREIEKKMRDFAFVEYSVLLPKGLLHKDDLATLDTLKSMAARNESFMRGNNFDVYAKARHKSVRDVWQKEMDVLVDEIYQINKPRVHKVVIESIQ